MADWPTHHLIHFFFWLLSFSLLTIAGLGLSILEEHMSIATVSNMVAQPKAGVLDEVFREYYTLIYRTAYGVTGSIEDAEDIVQTILLQILRHEIAVATLKNPKGYVCRAGCTRFGKAFCDSPETTVPVPVLVNCFSHSTPPGSTFSPLATKLRSSRFLRSFPQRVDSTCPQVGQRLFYVALRVVWGRGGLRLNAP